MKKKPLIFTLMGPTASGKTDLAMAICDRFPVDIISVDSALIYRGMNIGTAKPTEQEQQKYPHKLINIKDPAESYSAADFCYDAQKEIHKTIEKGRVPLLVGGTMLYFKALLEGLSPLPAANYEIRQKIENQANQEGWECIHRQLAQIDPVSAKRIHPNDPQRLSRALEVYLISGQTLTELIAQSGKSLDYRVVQFAMNCDNRQLLHERIEKRFLKMLNDGFEEEVKVLKLREDLLLSLPSMRCVGYRQMWQYLEGEYSYDEMIFRGISATRQLAKRQITWLRGWKHSIKWVNSDTDFFLSNIEAELV